MSLVPIDYHHIVDVHFSVLATPQFATYVAMCNWLANNCGPVLTQDGSKLRGRKFVGTRMYFADVNDRTAFKLKWGI